jgi:hypothetical protein
MLLDDFVHHHLRRRKMNKEKYIIKINGKEPKFLYRTHMGTYIFTEKPNMFFETYDQAQNWLNNHSSVLPRKAFFICSTKEWDQYVY